MNEEAAPSRSAAVTLRAACALALAASLLALVELSPALQAWFEPLNVLLARLTEIVLGCIDIAVHRDGAVLTHPDGFAYRITYVCSGARPAVLVVAAVLAVPAAWRWRLAGLATAFVALEALNLARLVHLYWTGAAHPEAFFFAHRVVWNAAFVAMVGALLALWLARATRSQRSDPRRRPPARVHV